MRRLTILGIFCLLVTFSPASELANSFHKAAALGEAQENATGTKDYFRNILLPYYSQKYGPVLDSCFATVAQPDDSAFSFVAVIDADGRVSRIYNDHGTDIFACLRDSLKNEIFPKPPVSPYYFHMDMKFSNSPPAHAETTQDAPPLIVEPGKYSYTFGVPKGWEFSFEQARTRGAALAFFPKGGSFNDSSTVIYVNEIDDGCAMRCMSLVSNRIAATIQDSRDQTPALQVTDASPETTKDGGKALIRLLSGTKDPRDLQREDKEALAFIGHDETIILVVLTARDPKTWEQDYSAFQELLAGHKFFNCNSPGLRVPCSH